MILLNFCDAWWSDHPFVNPFYVEVRDISACWCSLKCDIWQSDWKPKNEDWICFFFFTKMLILKDKIWMIFGREEDRGGQELTRIFGDVTVWFLGFLQKALVVFNCI